MHEFNLPDFIVIPDTNTLYSEKPQYVISQKFTDLLAEMQLITNIKLLIPEAVKQEIIFQQIFIGKKSRDNASKSLGTIANVTGKQKPGLPSDRTLRTGVTKTFSTWVKNNNARVIKTPVDSIDWLHIVTNALHRLPPFSQPTEPGDNTEKGFRDALILETLKKVWVENNRDNIAFICNDAMLCEAAKTEGKAESHLFFKSVDEFHSHLKLLQEEKDKKFIKLILSRAPLEFWNPDDNNNIYNNFEVWSKITTEFASILSFWIDADEASLPAVASTAPAISTIPNIWNPVGNEKVYVNITDFDKIVDPRQYYWKTNLSFVRLCQRKTTLADSFIGLLAIEKIRTAKFDVHWSAEISSRGKFSNHKLENIESVGKSYETATHEKKSHYGFVSQNTLDSLGSLYAQGRSSSS